MRAARDAQRVLTLSEQVVAGVLHAACQGLELRQAMGATPPPALAAFHAECRERIAFVDEDRALESDLRDLCAHLQTIARRLYD